MRTKERDIPYCGVRYKVIKKANPVLNEQNTAHLMQFIIDRYGIYYAKDVLKLPAPWTKNPILSTYKFTNIFRENDRVSKALIKNVSKNKGLSLEDKVANTFLFRSWNNPYTFTDFGGPWSAEDIYNGLKLKETVRPLYKAIIDVDPDRKWFSVAYNQGSTKSMWKYPDGKTHANNDKGAESDIPLRIFHIGPWLKKNNVYERVINAQSQKEVYDIIQELPSFAYFLSYQVFVDLTYIKDFPFSENEFTIAGPGCKRGLSYVFEDTDGMTPEECLFWLRDNMNEMFNGLSYGDCLPEGYEWNPEQLFKDRAVYDRYINVMSLENCFCELSKYMRTYNKTGRPKVKYKPTKVPKSYNLFEG